MENLSDLNKQLYFCQNVLSKRIPLQLIEEDISFYIFDDDPNIRIRKFFDEKRL